MRSTGAASAAGTSSRGRDAGDARPAQRDYLAVHRVEKSFAGRKVVRGVNLYVRRGEAVGLLPDQVPPDGLGAWAPFFCKPAYTMTLAARLVQQTGALPLLAWGERLEGGRGWVVHVAPFEERLPEEPAAQAESAAAVNRAMETLIRRRPQQYLWGYNRYKTPSARAPGSASSVSPRQTAYRILMASSLSRTM